MFEVNTDGLNILGVRKFSDEELKKQMGEIAMIAAQHNRSLDEPIQQFSEYRDTLHDNITRAVGILKEIQEKVEKN